MFLFFYSVCVGGGVGVVVGACVHTCVHTCLHGRSSDVGVGGAGNLDSVFSWTFAMV